MPAPARKRTTRSGRLGSRLDEPTRRLIERAAELEHRKVSDFCVSAIADAARRAIADHETLTLSDRDRDAFFATLVTPPAAHERLARAFKEHERRIAR